ncbi:WUSCHEL-related homeobox 11 [Selaginella moellendorffii]|uniref:WUSCHEL-related homeobox 11 n=1 Tax=Selaginella moellendorffii TaxID=88036 RepID=UPI000D1C4766|nr:WUSCHEL-related homeobox 11 [Selaginella moellendorffii]|eukprot:XP_024540240.1 WUSCHEL-related homeobox 11 [Selaginella moellendorffii]
MRRCEQQAASSPASSESDQIDQERDINTELLELKALHMHHRSRRKHIEISSVPAPPAPTRPAQQRWRPNSQQLAILEEFYAKGTPPSQENVTEIAELIGHHGPVDESKVYYWFQNKKSREKRKRRRIEEANAVSGASASSSPAAASATAAFQQDLSSSAPSASASASSGKSMSDTTAPSPSLSLSFSISFDQSHRSFIFVLLGSEQLHHPAAQSYAAAQIVIDGGVVSIIDDKSPFDLVGHFGDGAALFDPALGRIVPTNERGVTLEPLESRAYTLVRKTKEGYALGIFPPLKKIWNSTVMSLRSSSSRCGRFHWRTKPRSSGASPIWRTPPGVCNDPVLPLPNLIQVAHSSQFDRFDPSLALLG